MRMTDVRVHIQNLIDNYTKVLNDGLSSDHPEFDAGRDAAYICIIEDLEALLDQVGNP